MKLKAHFFLLFFAMGFFLFTKAQAPFLFEKTDHDFGEFMENGGTRSTKFEFTNTGKIPLLVSMVNVSCGCTTPDYIKDSIMPGEKGWIVAKYDPKGRPGSFDKNLFVTFNSTPTLFQQLNIKGTVISEQKPTFKKHPFLYGSTSFSSTRVEFGEIKENREYTSILKVSNDGANKISFLMTRDAPAFIKIETPKEINPGDSANIVFTLHKQDLSNIWGEFSYNIVFVTNDINMGLKSFTITGKTVQDFSHLSKEELKKAPKIEVLGENFDFEEVIRGGKKSKVVYVQNNGKSNLEIRNIHSPCFCFSGQMEKKTIEPGQKAELTLKFDSIGQKTGAMSRGVTLYTNDPKNPEITVYGKINIVEKPLQLQK